MLFRSEQVGYKALRMFQGENHTGVKARNWLIGHGYDGVNNGDEEYIAFYPEQIKSATNNAGTFDPNQKSTLLSEREDYSDFALMSANADARIYSYDFLVNQPDMKVTMLPNLNDIMLNGKISQQNIIKLGRANAISLGGKVNSQGHIGVSNAYTGRVVNITNNGIRHGMSSDSQDKFERLANNSRSGSMAGDIVRSGIPINGLKPTAKNARGTYALASYALDKRGKEYIAITHVDQVTGQTVDMELVENTHSINTRRKKEAAHAFLRKSLADGQELYTASTISIRDFLDVVNDTFRSILPKDVLMRLNGTTETHGYYTGKTLHQERDPFNLSPRQILARAFMDIARTDGEKRNLKEYKNLVGSINRMEQEAKDLRVTNTEERRKKGDADKKLIDANTKRINDLEERITSADKRLLRLQNAAPLKALVKRESVRIRAEAVAGEREKGNARLARYKNKEALVTSRENVKALSKKLGEYIVNPSKGKSVPLAVRGVVGEFLQSINEQSQPKTISIRKEVHMKKHMPILVTLFLCMIAVSVMA